MTTRGETAFEVEARFLVMTDRTNHRPNEPVLSPSSSRDLSIRKVRSDSKLKSVMFLQDGRRNCMTSIFWMPVFNSPILYLAVNLSDHVHYYQGGAPFEYCITNPDTEEVRYEILGPDIAAGHKMQLIVEGGFWKAGRILTAGQIAKSGYVSDSDCDYSLIGEAVGPGFDFHDFEFVESEEVYGKFEDEKLSAELALYCHDIKEDWHSYYVHSDLRIHRAISRLGIDEPELPQHLSSDSLLSTQITNGFF